jgi:hypothetical protein
MSDRTVVRDVRGGPASNRAGAARSTLELREGAAGRPGTADSPHHGDLAADRDLHHAVLR